MIEVTNYGDSECNYCIMLMEHLSQGTGLSYGLINVLLFIVIGPVSILSFMCSTLSLAFIKNKKLRKSLTIMFFAFGCLGALIVAAATLYSLFLASVHN